MYHLNPHNVFLTDSCYCPGPNYPWVINDGDQNERVTGIKDHVAAGDYFASLATILDLTKQRIKKDDKISRQRLGKVKKDLLYLQKKYRIVEK